MSPRASLGGAKGNGKYFMSMQMTPNPLIKNSYASPVKETQNEDITTSPNPKGSNKNTYDLAVYKDAPQVFTKSTSKHQYATLSSTKKPKRSAMRDNSVHSNTGNGVCTAGGLGGSAIKAIPVQKIDISQFSNQMEHVPKIKGIKKQLLMQLYVAKCQDLVINTSKQQMLRFFDNVVKNNAVVGTRKLNFSDMALGD